MKRVVIIGAGAAGLACASTLTKQKSKVEVTVLEQYPKTARKLLATGNGRCNISNAKMDISYYNTKHPTIKEIITEFNPYLFFGERGMLIRKEGNLLYPFSNQASTVKKVLLDSMPGVCIKENCKAVAVRHSKDKYYIETTTETIEADYVVYATGSKAHSLSGEDNLKILEDLQLQTTPLYPSLVQLHTSPTFPSLKGVRVKADVSLCTETGKPLVTESGEVLFTEQGISGICVMQLSRWYHVFEKPLFIHIDMLPMYDEEQYQLVFNNRKEKFGSFYLGGIFNEKLANVLTQKKIHPKHLLLEVTGTNDAKKAQVMRGGLSLQEIDTHLQCIKYPNLFVIGEALDVDGDCGGYNLHFAFGSGEKVAKYIDRQERDNATNK